MLGLTLFSRAWHEETFLCLENTNADASQLTPRGEMHSAVTAARAVVSPSLLNIRQS